MTTAKQPPATFQLEGLSMQQATIYKQLKTTQSIFQKAFFKHNVKAHK